MLLAMPSGLRVEQHRGRRPPPLGRRRRPLDRARPGLLGVALASALLCARGLAGVLAGAASGPSPLAHGRALVLSPAKPAEAPAARAPRAAAQSSPAAKAKATAARPQTVLKKAINHKIGRNTSESGIIYNVTEDAKKGFRAVAELACLPGRPARWGFWAEDAKEAQQSAAKAILEDPCLHAVLNRPAQDLRNIVMKHVKRAPKANDVAYFVREDPDAAPEARFMASITVGALKGRPSCEGAPQESELLAKRAAAEAMLLSPQFQALVKPPAKEPTAPEVLQMLVDKKLRRVVTKEDIVYKVEERENMPPQARFLATVSLPFLRSKPVVAGRPRQGWKRARQAAAEALLADPVVLASLSTNPVADLRNLVNKKIKRKSLPDDVVYTITEEEATEPGGEPSFRARAELRCLVGSPTREGEARRSEKLAKRSAAEVLLEDPDMQRLLRSRDAADVLQDAVEDAEAAAARAG